MVGRLILPLMMPNKVRREGRVAAGFYEVVEPDGSVIFRVPLADVDSKLLAAIKRNGWEPV
jgi:hypothetical protein